MKALEELSQKFNVSPNCVKRQLHSVRTALTREIKKGNEDQKSKWKFYETVSFMKEDIVRPPKAEEVIEWSDEKTEQFIEFYKQMTSSGITYRDRNLKELNYKRICEILPARSQEVVKRLWLILKTISHREIKKKIGGETLPTRKQNCCFVILKNSLHATLSPTSNSFINW